MKSLLLCAALAAGPAHAYFKDGNRLLADLNNNSESQIYPAIGVGYIIGVADALQGITYCPPDNITAGQLRDMVKNYLDNTPAVRHLPANQIISHIFRSLWPCAERPGRGERGV